MGCLLKMAAVGASLFLSIIDERGAGVKERKRAAPRVLARGVNGVTAGV